MLRTIALAVLLLAPLSSGALAQTPQKKADLSAKRERCADEARKMGLFRGVTGGLSEYVRSCVRR